jgi:hypothetical protein
MTPSAAKAFFRFAAVRNKNITELGALAAIKRS